MTRRADVIAAANLSEDGRMAAASPGPGFPDVLVSMWSTIRPSACARVADLGAGLGGASWWMQRQGAIVTAIEEQQECVSAGSRLFPHLEWQCAPIAEVDLSGFDGVTMFGLLSLEACPMTTLSAVLTKIWRGKRDCWVCIIDLFATGPAVTTTRNHFVMRAQLHDAAEGWTVRESRELNLDEQRSSWHDVGASIDVAVRMTTDDEVAKVVDDDHRVLSELIESGAVRPGLIVLEPNAGRTLQT